MSKTLVTKIDGKVFAIKITAKHEATHPEDIASKPTGLYLVFADDAPRALKGFSEQIPIKCHADFEMKVQEL